MRYVYKVDAEMTPVDYGGVSISLDAVLKEKSISRNKLKEATRLDPQVINRLYNSKAQRVDLDVIAKICYVLECDISDILSYSGPDKK